MEATLKKRFESFHKENPWVWAEFQRHTFNKIKWGWTHLSAKYIWELIREDCAIDNCLNNDHVAFYARMFLRTHRKYAGIFEIRKQRTH